MMKQILQMFLLWAFSIGATAASRLLTYPAPEGAPRNNDFSIRVRIPGGEWQEVDAYAWNVDRVADTRHNAETSSVAYFDFEGEVEVAVTSARDIQSYRIRPLSENIQAQREGNTLRFRLNRPADLSVEVNGDIYHNLQLFANAADIPVFRSARQVAKAYKVPLRDVIYFGPGRHVPADSVKVGSGQLVYLAGGAYVKGYLSVWQADGAKVIGHGIVNPERQQAGIMIRYSRNIEVNGPITTQLPCGESEHVAVRNAKVISWYGWGDGMNVFASNHVHYQHVFCRTSDDCSTIYCTRLGYRGGCRDITIDNAVYWADVAHPIMIGLHGNIEANEVIENVTYKDIDILEQAENQVDYQGCFGINNGDNILVRNILFSDIRIENLRRGMLFNLRVCFNRKYCHAPGRGIEDITFRNVSYNGGAPNLSIITGYNEQRRVKNIRFENLRINGELITDDMPTKPKWYKTGDMANIYIGEHTEQISFGKTSTAQ